jgi:transposase-like protein
MMTEISYSGYRFPPEIIQQAIWLYVRFTLSFRDVRGAKEPVCMEQDQWRFRSVDWLDPTGSAMSRNA